MARLRLTKLLLLCIVCGACGSEATVRDQAHTTRWPRVTHLADGLTVSVWRPGRVVERSRRGTIVADSNCGSYARYRRWVAFMSSFRLAVLTNDRAGVAVSVSRPLRWNHGPPWRSTAVTNRAQLRTDYGSIFAPAVVRSIKAADPRALFCRDVSMVMLGSDVAWGDEPHGRPAIVSINAPA